MNPVRDTFGKGRTLADAVAILKKSRSGLHRCFDDATYLQSTSTHFVEHCMASLAKVTTLPASQSRSTGFCSETDYIRIAVLEPPYHARRRLLNRVAIWLRTHLPGCSIQGCTFLVRSNPSGELPHLWSGSCVFHIRRLCLGSRYGEQLRVGSSHIRYPQVGHG